MCWVPVDDRDAQMTEYLKKTDTILLITEDVRIKKTLEDVRIKKTFTSESIWGTVPNRREENELFCYGKKNQFEDEIF